MDHVGHNDASLGREDSNLGMVESKTANPLNDFNGHSEKKWNTALTDEPAQQKCRSAH
jgi:hypothetical protein